MFDSQDEATAKLKDLEEIANSLGYSRTAKSIASLMSKGCRRPMAVQEADEAESPGADSKP